MFMTRQKERNTYYKKFLTARMASRTDSAHGHGGAPGSPFPVCTGELSRAHSLGKIGVPPDFFLAS